MMHSKVSNDAISTIKYAAMMARTSNEPWAVYQLPGKLLNAKPYTGAQTGLIEVCYP